MSHPLVSIIIPVYNGARYLREAIDSALAQTWPCCEVLVINDGSTDAGATEAIARSYGERIRYFAKPNGGVASALNLGIAQMRGEFFSWLSHDDVYLPHKVASQMRLVETLFPAERASLFLFGAYTLINARGRPLRAFRPNCGLVARAPFYAVFKHMINGCTVLISKTLLLRAGGFNNLPTTQDYDLWFRLLRLTRPRCQAEPILLSRQHPEQGFRTPQARQEAARTFIRLMSALTEEEILACAPTREAFFSEVGRSFCEIDLKPAHDFAWSRADPDERRRYRRSCRRNLKRFLHLCGLLPLARALGLRWRRAA